MHPPGPLHVHPPGPLHIHPPGPLHINSSMPPTSHPPLSPADKHNVTLDGFFPLTPWQPHTDTGIAYKIGKIGYEKRRPTPIQANYINSSELHQFKRPIHQFKRPTSIQTTTSIRMDLHVYKMTGLSFEASDWKFVKRFFVDN